MKYERFENMMNAYKKYEDGVPNGYAAFITAAILFCKDAGENPYDPDEPEVTEDNSEETEDVEEAAEEEVRKEEKSFREEEEVIE